MPEGRGQGPWGINPVSGCAGPRTSPWRARSPGEAATGPAAARPVPGPPPRFATAVHKNHERNQPHNSIRDWLRALLAWPATGGTPGLPPDSGTGIPGRTVLIELPFRGAAGAHRRREIAADAARTGGGAFQTWDTRPYPGGRTPRTPPSQPSRADCQSRQDCSYHMDSLARQHLPLRHTVAGRPDRTARFAIAMLCNEHFYARMPPNA